MGEERGGKKREEYLNDNTSMNKQHMKDCRGGEEQSRANKNSREKI